MMPFASSGFAPLLLGVPEAAVGPAPLAGELERLQALVAGLDGQQVWIVLAAVGLSFTVVPALLALVTAFTRILLVLTILRQALGIGAMPPDRILTALALFLTLFTMSPTGAEMHRDGVRPWLRGELDAVSAAGRTLAPLRRFMLNQTRMDDLLFFASLQQDSRPDGPEEVSLAALIPAFVISELKTAFRIGIVVLLPFLVIDLIVAATITSLGLSGVQPASLAVPFKLLLFVMIDGWHLVVASLVKSFQL